MHEIVIVGAGLSGLTIAYELTKKQIPFRVIEFKTNAGGRINTMRSPGPIEMGATWFGKGHIHFMRLIKELQIEFFEQSTNGLLIYDLEVNQPVQHYSLPSNQEPSFRIKGGTDTVINKITRLVGTQNIDFNTTLQSLTDQEDHLELKTNHGTIKAKRAIITVPPRLVADTISFDPALSQERTALMNQTQTWMADSIKFAAVYQKCFWKEKGLSGMGFSQTGIIQEVHDHSSPNEQFFALKGFLNPDLKDLSTEHRKGLVTKQLSKMFGEEALSLTSYYDYVWEHDQAISSKGLSPLAPHQNNGHPYHRKHLMDDKLIFSGTETAASYAGYMDGAVSSGQQAATRIIQQLELKS